MSSTPNPGEEGHFSSERKTAAVLRFLRGKNLELVSREFGVSASTLSVWREDFLAGGQAALKSRPPDARDDKIARLRARVGELTLELKGTGAPPEKIPRVCGQRFGLPGYLIREPNNGRFGG